MASIIVFYTVAFTVLMLFLIMLIFLNNMYRERIIAESVNYLHARGIKSYPLTHKITKIYTKKDILIGDLFFAIGVAIFLFGLMNKFWTELIFGVTIMAAALAFLVMMFQKKKKDARNEKYYSLMELTDVPNKKISEEYSDGEFSNAVKELLKEEERLKQEEIEVLKKIDQVLEQRKNPEPDITAKLEEETKLSTLKLKEMVEVLRVADTLLEKLPPEELNKFMQSDDFETYKRVMAKIKR